MRAIALILLLTTSLPAEMPNLSGVWKADLTKSKFPGPAPLNYLVIIEQKQK